MLRFFLYLSIGVTLGVVSIVTRSFVAAQTVMTSLSASHVSGRTSSAQDQSSARDAGADKASEQLQIQESANDAFGRTLQEQWPVDVGGFCLLALGLGKLSEKLLRRNTDSQAS